MEKPRKRRKRSPAECQGYDVNSAKLFEAWRRCPDGSSDEIGLLLMRVADRCLGGPNLRGYPFAVREELRSEMILKMIKVWHCLRADRAESFFGYLYMAAGSAAKNFLKKHYRAENLKRIGREWVYRKCKSPPTSDLGHDGPCPNSAE